MFELGCKPEFISKEGEYWVTAEPEYWYTSVPSTRWFKTYCLQQVECKRYFFGLVKVWRRKPRWMQFKSRAKFLEFGRVLNRT